MVLSSIIIFLAVQIICACSASAEIVATAPLEIPSPIVPSAPSLDPNLKFPENSIPNAEENSVGVSPAEPKGKISVAAAPTPELSETKDSKEGVAVKISQVTQKLLDSKGPGSTGVNIVQSSPLATSIVEVGRPVPTKKTKTDSSSDANAGPATQVPLSPLAVPNPTSPTALASAVESKPSGSNPSSLTSPSQGSSLAPTSNAAKGPSNHLSGPIPANHLSSPHNSGSLILPGSGGKGPEGYTYVAASGSADLHSSDAFQSQVFGWTEGGGQVSPTLTGAGGQLGFGAGAAIDSGPVQGQVGLSFGGTTGLGFSSPSHHHDDHHQVHSGSAGGGGGSAGPNIFGFLQSLPAPFSSLATAGSGGYEKLNTVAKPGSNPLAEKQNSPKPGAGLGASGKPEKQDSPKPSSPPGIFGIFSPFTTFSSSILSDDDDETEEEKQGPGGASSGSGSLFGILESLPTFTGNTEGSFTIQGGANIKPFLPYLNKPLCPEALELCINSCRELGKSGGILSQGNKCHCSCPVPDHLAGGNLCSNKYTSHCNKFCRTNSVTSYESGHCNSVTGDCECKSPLGKPCFGHHHNN